MGLKMQNCADVSICSIHMVVLSICKASEVLFCLEFERGGGGGGGEQGIVKVIVAGVFVG